MLSTFLLLKDASRMILSSLFLTEVLTLVQPVHHWVSNTFDNCDVEENNQSDKQTNNQTKNKQTHSYPHRQSCLPEYASLRKYN